MRALWPSGRLSRGFGELEDAVLDGRGEGRRCGAIREVHDDSAERVGIGRVVRMGDGPLQRVARAMPRGNAECGRGVADDMDRHTPKEGAVGLKPRGLATMTRFPSEFGRLRLLGGFFLRFRRLFRAF